MKYKIINKNHEDNFIIIVKDYKLELNNWHKEYAIYINSSFRKDAILILSFDIDDKEDVIMEYVKDAIDSLSVISGVELPKEVYSRLESYMKEKINKYTVKEVIE